MDLQQMMVNLAEAASAVVSREIGPAIRATVTLAFFAESDDWVAIVTAEDPHVVLVRGDPEETPEGAVASLAMELGVDLEAP